MKRISLGYPNTQNTRDIEASFIHQTNFRVMQVNDE